MTYEWVNDYMGHAWESGATGPDAWDCWTLFRDVMKKHYNIVLPLMGDIAMEPMNLRRVILGEQQSMHWARLEEPEDGCAVLMYKGRYASHVGVWLDIDGGRVLHSVQGSGTACTSRRQTRDMGWSKMEFYRHWRKSA